MTFNAWETSKHWLILKAEWTLPLGPAFVIGFFLVDQALCVYIHAFTPSKKFPLKETLTHVVWGFLNTKTYTLVVLLHMMNAGVTIPIWLWALDAYFQVDQRKFMISDLLRQVTQRFAFTISSQWAHWVELFYHQHRMAHLPKVILLTLAFTRIFFKVYEHAHKLHHYLHGTLSFDAHIYGGSEKTKRPQSQRSFAIIQATECQRSSSSFCLSLALELVSASPQLLSTDWYSVSGILRNLTSSTQSDCSHHRLHWTQNFWVFFSFYDEKMDEIIWDFVS